MHDTIPHAAPPLVDIRVEVARKALAELPEAGDNEEPYYWIGRLKTAMEQLLEVAAPAPGGLDAGQREVLASALADASGYREGRASDSYCADCSASPASLCPDHEADLDLHDAYVQIAAELGIGLHFDRPYGPGGGANGRGTARHYTGWAADLDARLAEHAAGRGARLLAVVQAAGIGWQLARTWPGGRARERQIKRQGGASRCCPMCGVQPRGGIR